MKIGLLLCLTIFSCASFAQSNYDKAWKALNANKWQDAEALLKEAQQDNATFKDAYITNLYLQSYRGKERFVKDFASSLYQKADNPFPYVYALWFNDAVAGSYGKKHYDFEMRLLNQLLSDPRVPGTLTAAANYQMGMHYLFSNEIDKSHKYYDQIGNIRNWQFAGPFENISQSGHYKNFGPLDHPKPDAVFKSKTNAEVKWFAPADEIKDGWTPVMYQFNQSTATVYAQNFVQSTQEQTVYCNVGASGSLKVWINDELVITEPRERLTELDAYSVRCNLKKGTNRVLVQLAFTDNSFPNFSVRFTDEQQHLVPGITGSSVYSEYPHLTGNASAEQLTPFAEKYFTEAIAKAPDNLVNYMLLADTYLRSKKVIEARTVVSEALKKAPDNCLLIMKMIEALIKENNRTLLLEELARIRQLDPESLMVLEMNVKEFFDNQKYEDGAKELDKRIKLYGEDESTAHYKLVILANEKKYEELATEVERLYGIYPTNETIVSLMYSLKKEMYKDKKAAMKIYENFLKENYSYNTAMKYADILAEQGDNDKALAIQKKMAEDFPYSPSEFYSLSKYYYGAKQFEKAEDLIGKSIALAPYSENYWEQLGDIRSERKKIPEALDAYNQSLQYDPNQFTIINKIRKLQGKPELHTLFQQPDVDSCIKTDKIADAKNADYGYYYILDQKDVVCYPGGATEQYYTTIIRITNEKGVDRYKESSLSYGNSQSLLIEKAEVVKKNMARIKGEINDNQIVFANLEAGDAVVFKYRIRSYVYGRFAKDFWDRFYFGGQVYSSAIRYNLLMPADQPLEYTMPGSSMKPVISSIEDFKKYTWELNKPIPEEDEPLMPPLGDVSAVLHLSTVPSWQDITSWYADIANNKAEEDVEIIALYKKLFPPGQAKMNDFQKAKIIYDYIEANIRYSSVSFRQSDYVPQRPATTLITRLGDCKDLSSLFVTLARMAGVEAQLVLVDTKDNGEKNVILPSVEFNHCIVKATLDTKKYYIELTDNYLPFTSLPNSLHEATILEIPYRNAVEKAELKLLKAENRTLDKTKRIIDIKPNESDLDITVKTVRYGSASSSTRSDFVNLDNEKQLKEMEQTVAGRYKNNVKMTSLKFGDLVTLNDSAEYTYTIKVKNEVSEIGSMKTFRITYPDVVASMENFTADTRVFPIEYDSYEDLDQYETVVNIQAPAGSKFIELPTSESLSFKDMKFSIRYTLKTPDKLVVTRSFVNNRHDIAAADYPAFKAFFEKILKAEQKFITYK